MKHYKVKIASDGSATAEERTLIQSIGDTVTTAASSKEGVVGIAPLLVTGALAYGASLLTARHHTGRFSFNPFG